MDIIASRIRRFLDRISGFAAPRLEIISLPQVVAPPRRLTIADQWTFLTDIIKDAVTRAEEAVQCHVSATLQLDLAQYGLISLVDELSAVMNVGGRTRRATVHVLDTSPVRDFDGALAA